MLSLFSEKVRHKYNAAERVVPLCSVQSVACAMLPKIVAVIDIFFNVFFFLVPC